MQGRTPPCWPRRRRRRTTCGLRSLAWLSRRLSIAGRITGRPSRTPARVGRRPENKQPLVDRRFDLHARGELPVSPEEHAQSTSSPRASPGSGRSTTRNRSASRAARLPTASSVVNSRACAVMPQPTLGPAQLRESHRDRGSQPSVRRACGVSDVFNTGLQSAAFPDKSWPPQILF